MVEPEVTPAALPLVIQVIPVDPVVDLNLDFSLQAAVILLPLALLKVMMEVRVALVQILLEVAAVEPLQPVEFRLRVRVLLVVAEQLQVLMEHLQLELVVVEVVLVTVDQDVVLFQVDNLVVGELE